MLFSCLCGMASSCFLIKRPIQTFSLSGIANLRSHSLRSTTCLDLRGQNQICCHEEAVTAKEWDTIYHPEPHTGLITRARAVLRICAHTHSHEGTHTRIDSLFAPPPGTNIPKNRLTHVLKLTQSLLYAFTPTPQFHRGAVLPLALLQCGVGSHAFYKLQLHHLPPRDPL